MLPVLCAKYSIFFYTLSTGVIRAALFESLILHHKKNKPEDYCNIPPASTVDIPTGWEPRTKQQPTGLLLTLLRRAVLFKSSYPHKKKKRHTNVCLFLVRVVIQHFLKTIVVQFVFEVIG